MAIRFETVQVGDVLYDARTYLMGHTTMRAMGVWEVRVKELDAANRRARVSWNGNPPEWWHSYRIARLRRHPPEWAANPLDGARCYVCGNRKHEGHRSTCEHPRAVAARKRAAKGAP